MPDTEQPPSPSQPMARRYFVSGDVQGVFFREWTVGKAREIGVSGWVRNLSDGRVEVYATGEDELLDRLTQQLLKGAPASQVTGVQVDPAEIDKVNGFNRRQSA